ncbi:ABC-F family ATP-binding cassette domain-containing protein [Ktedonosporobacter rubrisoli]|uniref:ABC-F family ATP-binding cassette domain-containing protein n=1 Tax=Ktedonosporobacter rubrisoli TaxID=2509675 RepID=A0A4P6JP21_KTERU|nr:ABC-F family ATP-binding cassette domain-containing protein [Ktedonosporobacter rubrisoli]QBD76496.1 ABC-F family ATP-binding cassette domain-containing protein [Ktedonosporobacter rubrisoli]
MLLTVNQLTKTYGAITVLSEISFIVNAQDRIGIVGPNGVGKSTLFRLLTHSEDADQGSITFAPGVEYGYLPQATPDFYGRTIDELIKEAVGNLYQLQERMQQLESAMSQATEDQLPALLEEYSEVSTRFQERGGYELDYKIDFVLSGLHIDYLPRDRDVHTLSGGEKERIGLAILLLSSPDILLLDEPTNHLDFASMAWLESYLAAYRGALLTVSHDRQFLNRAVNQIFEIDEHKHQLKVYSGNYDAYVQAREAERAKWEEEYERQQEEIKALRKRIREARLRASRTHFGPARDNDKFARYSHEQSAQRTSASKLHMAEALLQRIEADPIPKPPELLQGNWQFNGEPMQSQVVLNFSHVSKQFGTRSLFRDLQLTIAPRARILLTGPNGAGKTTLCKLLMGLEQPDEGQIYRAPGVRIGYLSQEPALDPQKTVIETYRYDQVGYEGEFVGRLIGYGLFRLEDMPKKVSQLSQGQQRKLEIACLVARQPNVLLLDEPTNYISLDILETFEAAILNFPGPVLAISHDRWFIERFGGQIWELRDEQLQQLDSADYLQAAWLDAV